MFDIGMSEMVLLLIIGLIAIGPKQLPEVAAKVARLLNDFRRMTSEFTNEFTKVRESTQQALQETQAEIQRAIQDSVDHAQQDTYAQTPQEHDHHDHHEHHENQDHPEQLELVENKGPKTDDTV